MKLFTIAALGILGLTCFSSCKKDDDNDDVVTYPNYSQLKVGNYWIYQLFTIDTSGNSTPTSVYDSCYVEKDTLINGMVYYKMVRPSLGSNDTYSFWRDSLHYIVNFDGRIIFSSQDFNTIFYTRYITATPDTVCFVYSKMADFNLPVSTPAGIFLTSTYKDTYDMYPGWTAAGDPRYINIRYAENMGIVTETLPFYSSNPNYIERRLVRYHFN